MVPNTNTNDLGDLYTNTLNVDVIQGNKGFNSVISAYDDSLKKVTLNNKYTGDTLVDQKKVSFVFTSNTNNTVPVYTDSSIPTGATFTNQALTTHNTYDVVVDVEVENATSGTNIFTLKTNPVLTYSQGK